MLYKPLQTTVLSVQIFVLHIHTSTPAQIEVPKQVCVKPQRRMLLALLSWCWLESPLQTSLLLSQFFGSVGATAAQCPILLPLQHPVHESVPSEVAQIVGRGGFREGEAGEEGEAERERPAPSQAAERTAEQMEEQDPGHGGDSGG